MARDERMRHMQLYPGWSARDNYGARKKRSSKGKKREKMQGENGGKKYDHVDVCAIPFLLLLLLFRMSQSEEVSCPIRSRSTIELV
jgi:transcription factor 7